MKFVTRLDHLVLTVSDIEQTCSFYRTVLGMEVVEFENGRRALTFGNQKINLHRAGAELLPHAMRPTPGSADLCFLTDVPVADVALHLRDNKVEILEGPVSRTGAQGPLMSVYFRDPDGSLIEIANQLVNLNRDQKHAA